MSLGLTAPAAVAVEVRSPDKRVFRTSWQIGEDGVELVKLAPFEIGRPVDLRFALPGGDHLQLRAEVETTGDDAEAGGEHGGCALRFIEPPAEAQTIIMKYVKERLGIP